MENEPYLWQVGRLQFLLKHDLNEAAVFLINHAGNATSAMNWLAIERQISDDLQRLSQLTEFCSKALRYLEKRGKAVTKRAKVMRMSEISVYLGLSLKTLELDLKHNLLNLSPLEVEIILSVASHVELQSNSLCEWRSSDVLKRDTTRDTAKISRSLKKLIKRGLLTRKVARPFTSIRTTHIGLTEEGFQLATFCQNENDSHNID